MIDEALYDLLRGTSAISALVGARIYQPRLPQNVTLPAISISLRSTERSFHHTAACKVIDSHFQISCWADDPKEAKQIAAAVRAAIHGYNGTVSSHRISLIAVENEYDLPGLDENDFHTAVFALVKHKET